MKEDPRAIRTKELIKEATYALLHEGIAIHQLSVQRITKQAKLNRTTFYLHYLDVNDLVDALIEEKRAEIHAKIQPLFLTKDYEDNHFLVALLTFLKEERTNLILLFQADQLEALLHELYVELILSRRKNTKRVSENRLIDPNVKASALVGIIMWWFKSDSPIEAAQLAAKINSMFRRPIT